VVVDASTGETEALRIFPETLPKDSPGIVIVQHMPEHFTTAFSSRLNRVYQIEVKEVSDNDTVLKGKGADRPRESSHPAETKRRSLLCGSQGRPARERHRPSVDVLFRSAARYAAIPSGSS